MTGRWEPAKIQSVDGARYFVQANDPKIVNAYWSATASGVRATGSAPSAPATAAPSPVIDGRLALVNAPQPASDAAAANPNAKKVNRRPEGQTYFSIDAAGQKHLRAVAIPGDAKSIGTWRLKTGGQAVLTDRSKNADGSMTNHYEWAKQEAAGTITINANGTFIHVEPGGLHEAGTWADFGNNILELKGYEGETWTVSVWQGELEIVHPVGKRDWAYAQ